MNAFKLLVMIIIVSALIYLLLNFFGLLMPTTDFNEEVKEQLRKAEIVLGKLQTRFFPVQNVSVRAENFETNTRNVVFNCNDLRYCCEKSKLDEFKAECEKGIAWNEKKIVVTKKINVDVSSRCYLDVIFWCIVYIGKQPARLNLKLNAPMEVKTGRNFELEITTKNIGETFSVEIQRKVILTLLKTTQTGIERKQLEEIKLKEIRLGPNNEINEKIPLNVNEPGTIEIKMIAFETIDLTNFIEESIQIKAIGENINLDECKIKNESKPIEYDSLVDSCVEKYLCDNCKFAADCLAVWKKEGIKELKERTPDYAIKILATKNC